MVWVLKYEVKKFLFMVTLHARNSVPIGIVTAIVNYYNTLLLENPLLRPFLCNKTESWARAPRTHALTHEVVLDIVLFAGHDPFTSQHTVFSLPSTHKKCVNHWQTVPQTHCSGGAAFSHDIEGRGSPNRTTNLITTFLFHKFWNVGDAITRRLMHRNDSIDFTPRVSLIQ